MKKMFLFAACAAVAVMATSCGGSTKTEAVQDAEEVEVADEQHAVPVLTDDAMFRPEQQSERITVLDFNAVWCGPCKRLNAPLTMLAQEYADYALDFYSVDFEQLPETAAAFGVENVPVVVILHTDGSFDKYETLAPFISEEDLGSKTPQEVTELIHAKFVEILAPCVEELP